MFKLLPDILMCNQKKRSFGEKTWNQSFGFKIFNYKFILERVIMKVGGVPRPVELL